MFVVPAFPVILSHFDALISSPKDSDDIHTKDVMTLVRIVVSMVVTSIVAFLLDKLLNGDAFSLPGMSDHDRAVKACIVPRSTTGLDDIGGLEAIKEDLRRSVILPLRHPHIFFKGPKALLPPKGVLLHGPPGTGKTLLAKAIATESNATFLALSSATLESKWWGESAKLVEAAFRLARTELQPCVVFFDEIDGMGRTRTEHDQACVYSFKTELLRNMDGFDTNQDGVPAAVMVVACTNNVNALDAALRRRLPHVIHVGRPDTKARLDILHKITRTDVIPASVLSTVASLTEGYTGSDLAALYADASSQRLAERNLPRLVASLPHDARAGELLLSKLGPMRLRHWKTAIQLRHSVPSNAGEG